jgi:hypothetical protein
MKGLSWEKKWEGIWYGNGVYALSGEYKGPVGQLEAVLERGVSWHTVAGICRFAGDFPYTNMLLWTCHTQQ